MGRKGGKGMGMGMPGLNMDMIKQAQKMQADMERTQAELQEKEYTATAGGGVVSATVDGKHTLKALTIDPEAVDPEDVEMLQDMVIAAVNEAVRAAMEDMSSSMGKITGGMNFALLSGEKRRRFHEDYIAGAPWHSRRSVGTVSVLPGKEGTPVHRLWREDH